VNIGEASQASGVPAKLIRYYERIGLIRPADRTGGNYRTFTEGDVNDLGFIRRARALGFAVAEISELLSLWRDAARSRSEVKTIADAYVTDLESRIGEMEMMVDTLRRLSRQVGPGVQAAGPGRCIERTPATSALLR
jgi:MerR family gold-responsive transcriptional activator of gol and ges genes